MSKDPKILRPAIYPLYVQWSGLMAQNGFGYAITRTGCSLAEQMAIYTQGRMTLPDVNRFRTAAGLYLLAPADNKVVTWTLKSEHILGPDGYCNAWDFVLLKDGRPTWDVKIDVDNDQIPDYVEAGKLAESIGLVAGMHFKDFCHIQGK